MASNPDELNPTSSPDQPKLRPKPTSADLEFIDPKTGLRSFIVPGSADAAAFVTPDMAGKFKTFLDAFYKANNVWYQRYKGLKCIDRPAFSTAGKEAVVAVNSHKVLKLPSAPVYQYDVSHGLQF